MPIQGHAVNTGSAAITFALMLWAIPAWPHGDDTGPKGGKPGHVGADVDLMEPDDSLPLCLDLYGYLGSSRAGGLRAGEPLGAGGKMPVYYNQKLYQESPAERPHMEQPDLRPGYSDFSYIPIWQPDQAEMRAQYRFLPRIWGSLSLAFSAEPNQVEMEDASHALQIEELWLKWSPERFPALAITLGSLELASGYCPIFDRFALEHSGFSGLRTRYAREDGSLPFALEAAAGAEISGRLKRTIHSNAQELSDPLNSTELDGERDRIHALLSARLGSSARSYVGLMTEYQALPEDSTVSMPMTATVFPTKWPASHGWQVGCESGWHGEAWEHHLSAARGQGDVHMAWSAPDAVWRIDRTGWNVNWSHDGSALTQATYWGSVRGASWNLDWGAWWQWRQPAKDTSYPYNTDRPGPDSVATLRSQDFRALRYSGDASFRAASALTIGLRVDAFVYLDPKAHANTQEYLSDAALRNIPDTLSDGSLSLKLGPSPWEREAVNARIFSPYAQADLGGDFHARATWTGAWYGNDVWRQGKASAFHSNFTLAAWFTYRFNARAGSAGS